MIISGMVGLGIVSFGALVKDLYDRVDAQDRARHAERLREAVARKAQEAPEGTIPLTFAPSIPAQTPPAEAKIEEPATEEAVPVPSD